MPSEILRVLETLQILKPQKPKASPWLATKSRSSEEEAAELVVHHLWMLVNFLMPIRAHLRLRSFVGFTFFDFVPTDGALSLQSF